MQLNYALSEIVWNLNQTRSWAVSCICPNESGTANSVDERRVKVQIVLPCFQTSFLNEKKEFIVDFEQTTFCDRYMPTIRGPEGERIRQCTSANGWKEGEDGRGPGHLMIGLTYTAWKVVEDVLRVTEKESKRGVTEAADDKSVLPDDTTECTHQELLTPGA